MAVVEMKSVVKLFGYTAAELTSANLVFPEHMPVYETDTGRMKIGDGVSAWNALEYTTKNPLSDSEYAMITNAGSANGFAVLGGDGVLPLDQLPNVAKTHIQYKADIAARDAVPEASRTSMFVVIDASADPTVDAGYATYVWDTDNTAWVKISEGESLDVDFSVFYNKDTEDLDVITDGTTYCKMTYEERALIAGAVQKTDTIVFTNLTLAEMETYINS